MSALINWIFKYISYSLYLSEECSSNLADKSLILRKEGSELVLIFLLSLVFKTNLAIQTQLYEAATCMTGEDKGLKYW